MAAIIPPAIGGPIVAGTAGSILFANPANVFAQDNANLFWDATNHRLGIRNAAPDRQFLLGSGTVSSIPTVIDNLVANDAQTGYGVARLNKTLFLYIDSVGCKLDAYDYGGSATMDIQIATNGGNVLFNGSTTKVGIGLGNPGKTLSVLGTCAIGSGTQLAGNTSIVEINGDFGANSPLQIFDTRSAIAGSGGNFALGGYISGTSTPTRFCLIAGNKENATAGNASGEFQVLLNDNSGGGFPFQARLVVLGSSGFTGIGTASPQGILHVSAVAGKSVIYLTQSDASVDCKNWYFDAEGDALYWGVNNDTFNNGGNYAKISRSGHVVTQFDIVVEATAHGPAISALSNGNVGFSNISPGALVDIGTAGSLLGTLRLEGNTSGYVQLQSSAAAGSWTMTLPSSAGTANYALITDGSGVTSWSATSIVTTNVALTAQTADITTTNFTGANTANRYRVNYVIEDTVADLTAGTLTLTIAWTDGAGATTATASQVLTGTGRTSGTVYIQLASGNITYAVSHTGLFGTAQYALYATVERLS